MSGLEPPIFVVGSYRGGTSLLERVLLCHSELAGPGFETQLFSRVHYGRTVDHPAEYEALVAGVPANGDEIARFTAAVGELTRQQGARCWVEKSPEHIYRAAAIVTRFPGARIVYVVRDGRDVVTSILRTPWAVPHARGRRSTVVAGAVLWELMTFAGLRVLANSTFGPTVLAVRYESLVREPAVELRRLAAFLGLPDDDNSIASWLCRTGEIKSNSLIEPELRGIGSSPVGRWRERRNLAESEVAIVQYLVGPTLVRAGYELVETKPLSRTACARAAAAKAVWLAIRAERYATTIGRGAPPHFVADASASMFQLLGRGQPMR